MLVAGGGVQAAGETLGGHIGQALGLLSHRRDGLDGDLVGAGYAPRKTALAAAEQRIGRLQNAAELVLLLAGRRLKLCALDRGRKLSGVELECGTGLKQVALPNH